MTSKILALAAAAALALTLAACSSPAAETPTASPSATVALADGPCTDDSGVTVIVDPGDLQGAEGVETCIAADGATGAADLFAAAQVETEGTKEFGDQVVCRVDGMPSEDTVLTSDDGTDYTETCESMPAAFAYWALWVKPAGGEWDYAQEGLSSQQVSPGDSVELLFTLNGAPAAPTP